MIFFSFFWEWNISHFCLRARAPVDISINKFVTLNSPHQKLVCCLRAAMWYKGISMFSVHTHVVDLGENMPFIQNCIFLFSHPWNSASCKLCWLNESFDISHQTKLKIQTLSSYPQSLIQHTGLKLIARYIYKITR